MGRNDASHLAAIKYADMLGQALIMQDVLCDMQTGLEHLVSHLEGCVDDLTDGLTDGALVRA